MSIGELKAVAGVEYGGGFLRDRLVSSEELRTEL